ncbi:hypothetical protein ACFLY8_05790 [Halobacteriota archaeon]
MKIVVILLVSFFIVVMVAGCVESNIPESTPTVMPMSTPTAIQRATSTSEKAPDIEKINRNDLGQMIYTGFTPEETQKLRDVVEECPDCHHDYFYSIIIVEIEGELWWVCQGSFEEYYKELGHICEYPGKKVTETDISRYLG